MGGQDVLSLVTQLLKTPLYPSESFFSPARYMTLLFFNQCSITEAGRVPLTHKMRERQRRERGAGNLIHLVFIWPSKTTPCATAIHPAVDMHVCAPVCYF